MRLGELLVEKKMLTEEQLQLALEEQLLTKEFLGEIVVRHGLVSEEDLMKVLSEQFGIPCMKLRPSQVDWDTALHFSPAVMERHCLPIRSINGGVLLAITNPLDAEAVSLAEREAGRGAVKTVLVTLSDMKEVLEIYTRRRKAGIKKLLE